MIFNKGQNEDGEESSEEGESIESQEDDDIENFGKDERQRGIEKVLGVRTSESDEKEYLVKYIGRSYRCVEWISEHSAREGAKFKVQGFINKVE